MTMLEKFGAEESPVEEEAEIGGGAELGAIDIEDFVREMREFDTKPGLGDGVTTERGQALLATWERQFSDTIARVDDPAERIELWGDFANGFAHIGMIKRGAVEYRKAADFARENNLPDDAKECEELAAVIEKTMKA